MPIDMVFDKENIIRDPDYLDFIRSEPCVFGGFGCLGDVVPAHQNLGYGMTAGKIHDRWTLPLCMGHHTIFTNAEHRGSKTFWENTNLDPASLVVEYNMKYSKKLGLWLCKSIIDCILIHEDL